MTKIEPGFRHWFEEPWRGMDLSELLAKHDRSDVLRSSAEAVLQRIMAADVTA